MVLRPHMRPAVLVLLLIVTILVVITTTTLTTTVAAAASQDYYSILGVPRNAPPEQIRKAYNKLTMKFHPDRNRGDKDAAAKYTEVNRAYEVLKDEKQRNIYDRHGEEGLKRGGAGGGGGAGGFGGGFGDIFADIFGGHFGGHFGGDDSDHHHSGSSSMEEEQLKGDDLQLPLEVTLSDLYSGKMLSFRRVRSAHKDGESAVPKPCQCRNNVIRMEIVNGVMRRVVDNNCAECQNRFDVVQAVSDLTVVVDRGMKDGETLMFYGEGDATRAKRAGNLVFVIRTMPHAVFTRQDNDLKMKMVISLKEALVGFTKTVEKLDGSKLEVKMDTVIKQGDIRKIPGQGMPLRSDPSQKGDLYIEFHVQFPTSLTAAQKEQISKIL